MSKRSDCFIVEYDPDATLNNSPDGKVLEHAYNIYNLYKENPKIFNFFLTGTATKIMALRILVARGIIPHEKIRFKYKEDILLVREDGGMDIQPEGFCNIYLDMNLEILKSMIGVKYNVR